MKTGHDRPGGGQPVRPAGSAAVVLAASAGSGIAHLGTSTMPFQIGALAEGAQLSLSQAGLFGSCEIGALALSMLLIAPVMPRLAAQRVAFVGMALCLMALSGVYALRSGLVGLCLLGSIAGIGYGLVFSAVMAGVAVFANADRIYALANAGALVMIVALLAFLPTISSHFGAMGPFLGTGILLLIATPALVGFGSTAATEIQKRGDPGNRRLNMAFLSLWFLVSVGSSAMWSFAERIGHGLHIPPSIIGLILSGSTFCGIAGTLLAAATARRVRRSSALLSGVAGTAVACLTLGMAGGVFAFAVGVLLYWVSYMYLYSCLQSAAAAIDPSGRTATSAGGSERLGFAVGTPLGGWVMEHGSAAALGWFSTLFCVILVPVCLPIILRGLRSQAA